MKAAVAWLRKQAANPVVRPVEVWLVRAAVAWVAVKLGVSVDHIVK
jgi:hypothetical protein